jgi:gamma-glutamylaminecyclotransferase
MRLIFVYGTLKRGCSNHHYLAGQAFVGEARTASGYCLFELDGFPGMVARAGDREGVSGEVWSVDAGCLARLDMLEGLAEGLYRREPVSLLAPFATHSVEAYIYAHSVEGRREVGSVWNESPP